MMKKFNVISIATTVIILGIVTAIAAIKVTGKYRFDKSASEMLEIVTTGTHVVPMEKARDIAMNQDVTFVDLRTPKQFESYHLENALNIPFERLLDDDYIDFFKSGQKKVLYGETFVSANSAWMILTQYGYDNIIVLDGSVRDWIRHIGKRDTTDAAYKSEEIPLFEYEQIMASEED